MHTLLACMRGYRSLPSSAWMLLLVQFVSSASHFMAVPVLALHMVDNFGFDAGMLATVLTIHLVASRAVSLVTGALADSLGFQLLASVGLAMRGISFVGFAMLSDWLALSATALALGLGTAAYESAVYGAFSRHMHKVATRLFVLNSQALNLGVVVGPMIGAGLLIFDARYVFIGAGICLILLAFATPGQSTPCGGGSGRESALLILAEAVRNRRSLQFGVVCLPWWFLFSQIYVVLPMHAVRITGQDVSANAVLLVNGLAGIGFTIVSVIAFEKFTPSKVMLVCYGCLVSAYLFVIGFGGFVCFLVFVGLYTLVETLILPAIRSSVAALARAGHESTFQGAHNLSWALGGSLGYYVGGWLILNASSEAMWAVFAVVAVIGFGLIRWLIAGEHSSKRLEGFREM